MKIRPYKLSQILMGDFSLVGYSVAGEETVIIVPELDSCFDIGKCPREALASNHVLLSHGHADHVAGIPYYFAQRDFQGISGGTVLAPQILVEPLIDLMRAWGRVEGHVPPYRFEGMTDGDEYEIRRGLVARAFATKHVRGSIGFVLVEIRKKLKQEFVGLAGPEIVELKKKGIDVTNRVEMPLVAYLGDTAPANYSDNVSVANAKALLIECTFFDDDHATRAKAGKHIHVRELPQLLEGMKNENIIIVHVTRRTNMSAARKILKKTLNEDTLKRITFLMGAKHIAKS